MTRRHDSPRGSGHRTPLYDREIPTPSHAERARTLLGTGGTGTLCTAHAEHAGHPYGSFVAFGLHEGCPIFLVSALAEHTRNLRREPRASLMVVEDGQGDPLARGRVTLVGTASEITDETERLAAKAAYLEANPSASYYVDFRDFSFWRLTVETARYIGGYGRMSWLEGADWGSAEPDPIRGHAERIINHMNADHTEALTHCTQAFSLATELESVTMTSIDRYGFEVSVVTSEGPRPVRIAFPSELQSAKDARTALVELTKAARAQLAESASE
jgi:putative heme iron utilization protein